MATPQTLLYMPASTGQELGVLFGFAAAMVLAMCGYLVLWKVGNKRSARIENERREVLAQKGIYNTIPNNGNIYDEKVNKDQNVEYTG